MTQWWRDAVFYQVYVRSFRDSDGDGVGDLRGIIDGLDYVQSLGVDALWISPCFTSPQVDHGYDVADYRDIDPLFGSLADMDDLVAQAHRRGIRITLDFVPNHTSDRHRWFQQAVAAGRGSAERERYLFRDGRGERGELPPNNWMSVFGGHSWTRVPEPEGAPDGPAQWYYHLFAAEQPDLNWRNPEVVAEFEDVIRFWLDRGVDGFRIDVSDALMKDPDFPDTDGGWPVIPKHPDGEVHEVYRRFRKVFDSYLGDRMAVIETGADDETVAGFIRPDEMHLAFNFRFVKAGFDAGHLREAIDSSLAANARVGAPTTWVTDNHDTPRSVGRYSQGTQLLGSYVPATTAAADFDEARGLQRARAMALLLLALPGAVYIYNGQELGLPNVDDLPESALQDPVWEKSGRTNRGRDNCRIPMPWTAAGPSFGFSTAAQTWLPMPADWGRFAVSAQEGEPSSMLELYRSALRMRRLLPALGRANVEWVDSPEAVLRLRLNSDGEAVEVLLNTSPAPVPLPAGRVLLASADVSAGSLPSDASAWVQVAQ
ncbi:MAG: glycoside hydrolase family 13 protein [Actinomycetales bacterium]|nr:glycoside hydrolase family 13 protein [Actinomycetales bacterium]